jgi:hypothetical protein
MVVVLKENEITVDNLVATLEKFREKRNGRKKNLAKHFGKLKWDIDGVEYQKTVRNEWD